MANLTTRSPAYVRDIDAATMAATKIAADGSQSPESFTVGDVAPTGTLPAHLHYHTASGWGNMLCRRQPGISADAMLATATVCYRFIVPYNTPTPATGTITIAVNPTTGDTTNNTTIRVGPAANTYRLLTAGTGLLAAQDILIGLTENETARNIAHAIQNHAGTSGTQYHAATEFHPSCEADWASNVVTVKSKVGGTVGNSIQMVIGSNGSGGGGTINLSGAVLGTEATGVTRGGGNSLTQGGAYTTPAGVQLQASVGYRDESAGLRLVGWTYQAPTIPTIQNGGGATANAQLELMRDAGTSLFTLTASGASDALGKTQYSANGGGLTIPAGSYVWARVPSGAGASWKVPPGAQWDLYFARIVA